MFVFVSDDLMCECFVRYSKCVSRHSLLPAQMANETMVYSLVHTGTLCEIPVCVIF